MMSMRIALIVVGLCAAAARVVGAPPPMMELAVGDKKVEGKIVAQTSGGWWLVGQDGRLSVFKSSEVSKSRQLSPQFHGWNSSIMKDQLRREFGRPYEVVVVNDRFGIRLTDIATPSERLRRLNR